MTDEPVFSKIDHIGVIVGDMAQAVEYYESLGIGPFKPFKKIVVVEREIRGKSIPIDSLKVDVKIAKMGPIDLELLQPVKGESLWKEFLEAHGEGVQHLGFYADDLDGEEAKLIEKGINVAYKVRFRSGESDADPSKGGGDSYIDTDKVGGVILALTNMIS